MDAFALLSQERAARAIASGRFDREIAPVLTARVSSPATSIRVAPRWKRWPAEAHARHGDITPATPRASTTAPACLRSLRSQGRRPRCRSSGGSRRPCYRRSRSEQMGLGPVFAIRKLLARNGLTLDQIDLFELNEAFCGAVSLLREAARPQSRNHQRQRRRGCSRASDCHVRRSRYPHARSRAEGARLEAWHCLALHRRRHGHCHACRNGVTRIWKITHHLSQQSGLQLLTSEATARLQEQDKVS